MLDSFWNFEGHLDDRDEREPRWVEGETSSPEHYQPSALSEVSVVQEEDLLLGVVIGGKYRVEKKIGQGGMGEVYLGINDSLGQRVAIKFLSRKLADDEGIVGRFLNEAKSYCRVNHPNAVTLLEYGQRDDGTLYIITEFVEGKNLAETMKDQESFSTAQVLSIGMQICEVLSVAHGQGVIHRDLKPDNVMLTPAARGRFAVKVLDFGIAKIVDEDDGPNTETGSVFGTPEFMSPEQARGEVADPRSDIYALGIILFFMSTGKLPFRGKNKLVVLNKQLNDKPPRPCEINPKLSLKLEAVILKCLNKNRTNRYENADDLFEALEELQTPGGSATARPGDTSQELVKSIVLNTVRLQEDEDTDPHAETMAGWDGPINSGVLESVEISRPYDSGHHQDDSNQIRNISVLVVVALLVGAFLWAAPWRPSVQETLPEPLLQGQLIAHLSVAKEMLAEGNLDGAKTSLEQTEGFPHSADLKVLLQDRDDLVAELGRMEGLRTSYLSALRGNDCDQARAILDSMGESEKGLKDRLARQLARCERRGAPKVTQVQEPIPQQVIAPAAEPKPNPVVEIPAKTPEIPAEVPKISPPEVEAPIVPVQIAEPKEDKPELKQNDTEDGVLPPKKMDGD